MELNALLGVGITIVVVGLVLAVGLSVLSSTKADFVTGAANCGANSSGGSGGTIAYSSCGADYNGTLDGIEGVGALTAKLPLLGLVVAAALVIGILVRSFRQ